MQSSKSPLHQSREEAAAEAIHREVLRPHPGGSVFEARPRGCEWGNGLPLPSVKRPWCSCICELKLFLCSTTAIMTEPLPEGEGWGVDLSHQWDGRTTHTGYPWKSDLSPNRSRPLPSSGRGRPQRGQWGGPPAAGTRSVTGLTACQSLLMLQ